MVHKCIYDENYPRNIKEIFKMSSNVHCYRTRLSSNSGIYVNKINLVKGQKSLQYRGAVLWNNLTNDLKLVSSLDNFKHRLTKYLAGR